MQQKVAQAVQEALHGSRRVQITFKQGAVDRSVVHGIAYLLGMEEMGFVSLSEITQMMLRSVLKYRDWVGFGNNRTMLVTLTDKFSEEWFMNRIHSALEKIEVVDNKKTEVAKIEVPSN